MAKAKKSKSNNELAAVLEIVSFIKDYMMDHLITREEADERFAKFESRMNSHLERTRKGN